MALKGWAVGSDGVDVRFSDVDFISFVTDNTYGKPAIIAPGTDDFTSSSDRGGPVTVLYVNPANISALRVTKE